jgi:hypothetical protein
MVNRIGRGVLALALAALVGGPVTAVVKPKGGQRAALARKTTRPEVAS